MRSRASCPRAVMTLSITFSPFQVSRGAAAKRPSIYKDAIKIKVLQKLNIFLKKNIFQIPLNTPGTHRKKHK